MKKTVFKIAKTELYNLFFSPIAWLLLIVFLFQTGLTYTSIMERLLAMQNMGGGYQMRLGFLTSALFSGQGAMFAGVAGNLYLYIPLLTMGLLAREINGGTIKLLYSSPVKVREIVLGKYLAMMTYNLLLMAVVGIFVVTALFNIPYADVGLLLSGMLGLYLLLCAFSAIGLFMSCLTSYQVVAAISTLVMFAILNYIGAIWQDYDFFRDLTYFLSISGRTGTMVAGLITTRDVLYFGVIIYMFLGFSVYKLKGERETRNIGRRIGRYGGIIASGLAIGYVTSRPALIGYLDMTANKTNTLTPNAQKIIKEMGAAPMEVTTYINLLDGRMWSGLPNQRNADVERWEPYVRFKPDIKFRYVYYYDSTGADMFKYYPGYDLKKLAEKYAKSAKVRMGLFETPEEIHREIDLRPEQNRYVMHLDYNGRSTFLRTFNDMQWWPSETEVSAAFQRLQTAKLPKICFVEGEGERSIDRMGDKQYKILTNDITFRYSLVNEGFDVERVSLKDQDIPGDISALVIADPRAPFDTTELAKLRKYIAAGGNLLVAGEPRHAVFLTPLLEQLGVRMKEGMLAQQSKDFAPDLVLPRLTIAAGGFLKVLEKRRKDSIPVSMPNAAALTYEANSGYAVAGLLVTDSTRSWNTRRPLTEDQQPGPAKGNGGMMTMQVMPVSNTQVQLHASGSAQNGEGNADAFSDGITFSAAEGDESGSFATALSLTRTIGSKQQRIVVTGDADFLSNSELARQSIQQANFVFGIGLFSWLTGGEFPIDTSRPESRDKRVTLTDGGLDTLKLLFEGVLPGLLLAAGAVLLIRRKRK